MEQVLKCCFKSLKVSSTVSKIFWEPCVMVNLAYSGRLTSHCFFLHFCDDVVPSLEHQTKRQAWSSPPLRGAP